jgi:hypothetical protein
MADLPEHGGWFVKNLGDPMFASEALERIERHFLAERRRSGNPESMALFVRHESGRLHCEVKLYFSPAAAPIARTVAAVRCRKPTPLGLSLAAGAEASWSVLFPERKS